MERLGSITGHLELLPKLQRLFKIGAGIVVIALRQIRVPNVIQAQSLNVLVADIALDLEGLLE